MRCEKCDINNGEYNTKIGLLCTECYDKILFQVENNEEVKCSNCDRTILKNDYYALNDEDNIFCVRCFKKPIENSDKINPSDEIKCPQCGSNQVHAGQRGWKWTTGIIGSGKVIITCLRCGHQFKPGEGK